MPIEENQEVNQDLDEFAFLDEDQELNGELNTPEASTEENKAKGLEVTLRYDPIKEIFDAMKIRAGNTFPIPMIRVDDSNSRETGAIAGDEKQRNTWGNLVRDFTDSNFIGEQYVLTKDRMEKGDWDQGLRLGETLKRLCLLVQTINRSEKSTIDAEYASFILDESSDLAGAATIRSFSAGVSFRLKTLPLIKLANLFNRIATDKRIIGVDTAGSGYSAESTYLDENLLTLLKSVIIDANIEKFKISMLDEILTDQAVDELLLGLAALMYQKGFEFSRACIKNPDNCTHTDQGVIDLADSIWVDNSLLSDEQIKHWDKQKKLTLKEVKAYQDAFVYKEDEKWVSDKVKAVFKEPLMIDKISSGKKWLDTIHNGITEAFISEPSREERVTYLNEQMKMSIVGAYVPFIKHLEVFDANKEESRLITSQEAIRSALISRLGRDDKILANIIKGVLVFQAHNRLTVFGTLNYECPVCGTPQSANHGAFGGIIPYNPRVTFMNLGVRKIRRNR